MGGKFWRRTPSSKSLQAATEPKTQCNGIEQFGKQIVILHIAMLRGLRKDMNIYQLLNTDFS
jgi:hypothetical protein